MAAQKAGAGTAWLFPFVDGAPPIGWDLASRYLALPIALVIAQASWGQAGVETNVPMCATRGCHPPKLHCSTGALVPYHFCVAVLPIIYLLTLCTPHFSQYISNAIVQPPQTDDSDAAKFSQNLIK